MKTIHCSLLPLVVATLVGNSLIPAALANSPPTLSPIANLTITEDAGNQVVALSGVGPGAPEEQQTLTLAAVSSNPSLIPAPSIQYVSPNATGMLLFKPAANAFGTATITVTVTDGQPTDNTVSRSFVVTVASMNDLPNISEIADQLVNENTPVGPIPFTVSDLESPTASLVVSGDSSNPSLIPVENLIFAGSGANRTLTVTPAPKQFGSATISVIVSDTAGATARTGFQVTVNAQLKIKMAEKSPLVLWSATNAVLQHRGEQGQWEDMQPEATSPYSVPPSEARFYRLRIR
jgi:hypothetical protein